jgi:hypothetical protein
VSWEVVDGLAVDYNGCVVSGEVDYDAVVCHGGSRVLGTGCRVSG